MIQNKMYEKLINFFNQKDYDKLIDEYSFLKEKKLVTAFVLNLVGLSYANQNKYQKAIDFISDAIDLDPNFPDPYNNIAIVYYSIKEYSLAKDNFLKCLELNNNHFQAAYGLANTYKMTQEFKLAIKYYNQSINLDRNFYPSWIQKIRTQSQICDWNQNEKDVEFLCKNLKDKSFDPYLSLFMINDSALQFKIAKLYVENKYKNNEYSFNLSRNINKKIKIGYFSSDFMNHATMHLMKKMFIKHNHDKFDIYCYSYGKKKDEVTEEIKKSITNFKDISNKSDDDLIVYLRDQKIDIAIDLKGFCSENKFFIFSRKIAPIQVSYLGYPGTTGANFIDYIIADNVLINEENRKFFSEKIIFMPDSYQVNDDGKKISNIKLSREDYGLPKDTFVFCCFNKIAKIHKTEFDTWLNILKKSAKSILWLLSENDIAINNLKKYAKKNGVDPNRIIFSSKQKLDVHLARHRLADLFLDTFTCNAHTTASDALWAELPIITKSGNTFASRVASSLLTSLGLDELITYNIKDYENLAINLSENKNKLNTINNKLKKNKLSMSLFNTLKFTRNIENAYSIIYDKYSKNERTADIKVDKVKI
ncbi:MAG: hypothetical protein CMF54_06635 [Legionellales bacterium]|nr:hypothetical protein [Legionellales bacterium]